MRKNVDGQRIGAQINSGTDGSPITTGVTCFVRVDSGAFASCAVNHISDGYWEATPTQAQTNGDTLAFQFRDSVGVNAVQVVDTVGHTDGVPITSDLDDPGTIAAAVWAEATRSLTDKAGFALSAAANQAIRDTILSDSTPFAGANIDAAITSRGTGDADPGDTMDVGTIKGADAQRLADNMNAGVSVTVSSATDGTKFIISGANGDLQGRAIIFLDSNAGNANRGEARVILAHNTGTDEIDVGFADENVPGTGFSSTPGAGNTAIVV